MTWRGVFGVLAFGAALTSGCRTQESRAPAAGYDEIHDEELASEASEDEAPTTEDEAAEAAETDETEGGDDDASVQEQLAVQAVQSHLGQAHDDEASPLEFAVIQQGPNQPWVMGVVNRSDRVARLVGDPRLLSFDVEVPGKKKTVTCKLPESLRPAHAHYRYRVWLGPGQGVVKSFDPRLYCFAVSGQHVLVPGAIVTPKFGWPEKVKTVWRRGKKETVKLEQSEPFIAQVYPVQQAPEPPPSQERGADEANEDGDEAEPETPPETLRIKELSATPLALGSEYKQWSSVGIQREVPRRVPIAIDMQQGSDAESQLSATVAITLKNRSKRSQYVYFRRELLSFEVMGPGGLITCDPQPDTRAPDRQAFLLLSPGRSMTITSRLVEMCPKGTFARPGFYLVHARFETDENGEEYGLDAYVGQVATEHPANVRIRSGELDPSDQQPMRALQIFE